MSSQEFMYIKLEKRDSFSEIKVFLNGDLIHSLGSEEAFDLNIHLPFPKAKEVWKLLKNEENTSRQNFTFNVKL